MPTAKDAHTLVSYFQKKYKEKHGFDAIVNRHAARWGFNSMLMDMSMAHCKQLVDYYFETSGNGGVFSLDWFLYNYEKLDVARRERDKDAAAQAVLREQSKRRAEEWSKKIGNNRSQGS